MRLRSFLSEKSWMQLLVDSKASKMPTICLKQPVMGEIESVFFLKSRRKGNSTRETQPQAKRVEAGCLIANLS